jgi:hypothetical protein
LIWQIGVAVQAPLDRAEWEHLNHNNCNIINILQYLVTNAMMKYPASESLSSYELAAGYERTRLEVLLSTS